MEDLSIFDVVYIIKNLSVYSLTDRYADTLKLNSIELIYENKKRETLLLKVSRK